MDTLKNKMIPTKVIVICILCSVVACDCKGCRNHNPRIRKHIQPQGTELTPNPPTPITDEMIVFASGLRWTSFLKKMLQDLRDGKPGININELSDASYQASGYSALHQAAGFLEERAITTPPLTKEEASELIKKIIQALLDRGAEVNLKNINGKTPLDLATKSAKNPTIISLLTEHGGHVSG